MRCRSNPTRTAAQVARRFFAAAALLAVAGFAQAQQQDQQQGQQKEFTPKEETPEEFAAGAGRDETFYTCTACHNFKLVAQQGMNRRQWEDILQVMYDRHGMPKLDDKDRDVVLSYLTAAYPPRAPRGGWQNPFLNR